MMRIKLANGNVIAAPNELLEINSKLFHYHRESSSFTVEASELEAVMKLAGHDRLSYVASRWGFVMRSHRTGNRVWFERMREVRDRENDLVSVEFIAAALPGVKLTVFND